MSSRKKQFIYIIWPSHDYETVKQISDENLTNCIIVRRCLRNYFLGSWRHLAFTSQVQRGHYLGPEGP